MLADDMIAQILKPCYNCYEFQAFFIVCFSFFWFFQTDFSTNVAGTSGYPHAKKNLNIDLIPFTKITQNGSEI